MRPCVKDPRVRIEALACWVDLTKTYYICVRESRNLTIRGEEEGGGGGEVITSLTPQICKPPLNTIENGECKYECGADVSRCD